MVLYGDISDSFAVVELVTHASELMPCQQPQGWHSVASIRDTSAPILYHQTLRMFKRYYLVGDCIKNRDELSHQRQDGYA